MTQITRCALCNSNEYSIVHDKAGLKRGESKNVTNVICLRCGLMYNNPMPTDKELNDFYTGEYVEDRVGDGHTYEAVLERMKRKNPQERIKRVFDFMQPLLKSGGSILDIGCSRADLLACITKNMSMSVVGVEPDPMCVRVAKEFYGLKNIHQGFFEDYLNLRSGEKFDFVIMRHVLEHMKDVSQTISQMKSLLKPDGYLFLAVPDCGNILPYRNLDQVFEYGHVFSFTPYTMHQLLWKHGLKIVKWSTNYQLHLQVIATPIENPLNAIPAEEFNVGFDISSQLRNLRMQKYRRNWYRILRKLGKEVQHTEKE